MSERRTGRKAVLQRLKDYAYVRRLNLDPRAMARTIAAETDRGSIILLGSLVEDALLEQLEKKMPSLNSDERERLFGPDKPLGSFSAKARVAHAVAIIDRDIFKLIDILREMRNICAHSQRDISFKVDELRDVLDAMLRPIADDMPPLTAENCRVNLVAVVHFICSCIATGDKDASAEDTNRIIRETLQELRDQAQGGASPDK